MKRRSARWNRLTWKHSTTETRWHHKLPSRNISTLILFI